MSCSVALHMFSNKRIFLLALQEYVHAFYFLRNKKAIWYFILFYFLYNDLQQCVLNVTTSAIGGSASYITAQGRESASEGTGFVFHSSIVAGTGPAFLGRAYRNFSRVLYYETHMENIVTPLGWDAWFNVGHE